MQEYKLGNIELNGFVLSNYENPVDIFLATQLYMKINGKKRVMTPKHPHWENWLSVSKMLME